MELIDCALFSKAESRANSAQSSPNQESMGQQPVAALLPAFLAVNLATRLRAFPGQGMNSLQLAIPTI